MPKVFLDELLKAYPVVAALPAWAQSRIAGESRVVTAAQGAVLFDERQDCRALPFVLSGSVRVVKLFANGRELPLYRVAPGETCILSTGCLLGGRAYNARGVALGETRLALLPSGLFDELMDARPFRAYVFGLLSARIAELMELVEEVAFKKLDQRLASLLLGHGPVLHVTHQQLADELGSVREMVSRLLKGFAEQQLVTLGREQIEILDAPGLRRIAEPQRMTNR